jgi:hypothetical protein
MTDGDDFEIAIDRALFAEYVSGISDDDVIRSVIRGHHIDPSTCNSITIFPLDS